MNQNTQTLQIGNLRIVAFREQVTHGPSFTLMLTYSEEGFNGGFSGTEKIYCDERVVSGILSTLSEAAEAMDGDWRLNLGDDSYPMSLRFRAIVGDSAVEYSGELSGGARLAFDTFGDAASVKALHDTLSMAWRPLESRAALMAFPRQDPQSPLGEFVRVPAGGFWMGPAESVANIHVDAFEIAKYPVTYQQFAQFVNDSGYRCHPDAINTYGDRWGYPAVHVSWADALAYCQWAGRVTASTIRLPTEAEWEKAARGPKGLLYPWGTTAPSVKHCNYGGRFHGASTVGRFSPVGDSPYGIADMAGNVWEWCADWYWTSPSEERRNPQGPSSGSTRVLRGGSWRDPIYALVTTHRYGRMPHTRSDDIGFRCVRSVLLPAQE